MKKEKLKILDCTLRDGGYYNNWDFDRETVDRYLIAVNAASVDVVELGFRTLPKARFMGPYIYTTDEFVEQLDLPDGPVYGVMINGKEFVDNPAGLSGVVNKLFRQADASLISLVRIAINFNRALEMELVAMRLKELGYQVGINLMNSHAKHQSEYVDITREIATWETVDVLYFADSLGNMIPEQVEMICNALKKGWNGPLGIHTHNNKSLALINSITATDNGVTWCDGTITGMGRGAGNSATESLLLEMSLLNKHDGDATLLQPAVEDFSLLKNKYDWGANLYYHYASNHNIHPTFVQELLSDLRYDNQQVLSALQFLSEQESSSYSIDAVRRAIYGNQRDLEGKWDATGWVQDREVLLVGAGLSIDKYREAILQYIERMDPAVLFLNINRHLPENVAMATIVAHETRALFDAQLYQRLEHPLVLPISRIGKLIKSQLKGLVILDYGLTLDEGAFHIGAFGCCIQWPLSAAYALAVVTQGGAKNISLVGFDGYTSNDPRHEEMNDVFRSYEILDESVAIVSLTPTSYRVKQSSIFSPMIR